MVVSTTACLGLESAFATPETLQEASSGHSGDSGQPVFTLGSEQQEALAGLWQPGICSQLCHSYLPKS